MADTAFAPVAVPRKPVASTENLIQWVPLTLVVSDHDTVTELLQKAEGRERDEYAMTALRIGVLTLKHARGQIDADAVKREGEKLMVDLKAALEQSRGDIHTNLTNALKEYFDPQSGRFQERLERLIKQDGDLEQVLRRQIGADGSELAKTLAVHIGENSSLMKLLNPEESDGLVSSIRSTVTEVIDKEQKCILGEFSLDNDKGALKRLVNELTHANGRLKDGLTEEIESVVKEFSLDREDSALSRLVRRVEIAEETITKEFSLDEEDSALSRLSTVINGAKSAIDANLTLDSQESALFRLKGELVAILEKHEQKVETFQTSVQTALEGLKAQRKAEARSTEHGRVFEDVAAEFVRKEAEKTGDIASSTGNATGLIKNCKVGDILIELGPDCAAAGERFVVEVKEDASYTLAKARGEIEVARKNRGANVGLFLFSAKTALKGMDALVRHGEDVFVVWDSDRIESDVVLRAGLSLAKALCVRQQKDRDAEDGNWEDIDAAILAVEKETGRLASMKTWTDTIQSNSGRILDEIRKMEKNLLKQVEMLRESVKAVKQS